MSWGLHANEVLTKHKAGGFIEGRPHLDATAPLPSCICCECNEVCNVFFLLKAPLVFEPCWMHEVVQRAVDSHACCFNSIKYLMIPAAVYLVIILMEIYELLHLDIAVHESYPHEQGKYNYVEE